MFQARLRAAMRDRDDMKQEDLAKKARVSQSSVSRILKGETDPTLDVAIRLAKVLNVSLDWLAGLPARTPGTLTPDEEQLLADYRAIPDQASKDFIRQVVKGVPKGTSVNDSAGRR